MVTRILVEKRAGFDVEAMALKEDIMKTLHMENFGISSHDPLL